MFNRILAGQQPPIRLSHDNDPLFHFHRWQTNMGILGVEEIWSVPYIPMSHPYVERLIGTTRREFLDKTLFWNQRDLELKLEEFRKYFNSSRVHQGLGGRTPGAICSNSAISTLDPSKLTWKKYCRGLFNVPEVA